MASNISHELAAALHNLLEQAYQMKGMFPDDDETIANAINDAEDALQQFRQFTPNL